LEKQFNGHKICNALSDPARTRILRFLLGIYPEAKPINDTGKILLKPVSATPMPLHLKKLREAELIVADGIKWV